MKSNKKCAICGKEYQYCYGCGSNEPSWKNCFCDENCRKISHILSHHALHNDKEEDIKKKLEKCDLSELENFNPNIKDIIKHIMAVRETVKPQVQVINKQNNNRNFSKKDSDFKKVTNLKNKKG